MNLSILILETGEYLISQVEEMDYEPRCHMFQPYLISGSKAITLTRWPSYTGDEHILIKSDSLLTMVDPTDDIINKYLKKVGKKLEDFTRNKPTDRMVLNEGESILEPLQDDDSFINEGESILEPLQDDDSYEPSYVEEQY